MHYVQATVVIPTFNGCRLLAEALEGLGRQTVEHEVIVVDNASTDGTIELLAERFPRTRLVRLPENAGFGRADQPGRGGRRDGRRRARSTTTSSASRTSSNGCSSRSTTRVSRWSRVSCCSTTDRNSWTPLGSSSTRLFVRGTRRGTGRCRSWQAPRSRSGLAEVRPPSGPWPSERSAASTRPSSPTGRTSTSLFGCGSPGTAAFARRMLARCTSTARRSALPHPLNGASRPSAAATCSRGIASRGAACPRGRRSRSSTGRCSSSICSFDVSSARCGNAAAAPAPGSRGRPCGRRSSSRRSASARQLGRQAGQLRLRASGSLPTHFDQGTPGAP